MNNSEPNGAGDQAVGIPFVMLHGVLGGDDNWAACRPYLPGDCRAIVPAIPFFDERINGVNSVAAATDHVEAFIAGHAGARVVLGGNSIGGHIALKLALRHPERIRALVLLGSSGLFERGFSSIPGVHPSREWVRMKIAEVFYDPAQATEALVDDVMRVITHRQHRRDLVKIAISAKRDHVGEYLRAIACPTLLVWGRQDYVTPPEVAEQFHALIPDSELAWIDRCGHTPMLERPAEFGAILSDWWRRRVRPGH